MIYYINSFHEVCKPTSNGGKPPCVDPCWFWKLVNVAGWQAAPPVIIDRMEPTSKDFWYMFFCGKPNSINLPCLGIVNIPPIKMMMTWWFIEFTTFFSSPRWSPWPRLLTNHPAKHSEGAELWRSRHWEGDDVVAREIFRYFEHFGRWVYHIYIYTPTDIFIYIYPQIYIYIHPLVN